MIGTAALASEDLFEFQAPLVGGAYLAQRGKRFVKQRTAADLRRGLGQVADTRTLRTADTAGIRLDDPRDHAQQGRLTRAVKAHQADPGVIRHRPTDMAENG